MSGEMKQRRNTKAIGFNDEEYKTILKIAKEMGVYPRQAIMIKMRVK